MARRQHGGEVVFPEEGNSKKKNKNWKFLKIPATRRARR